jgi:hypothetical protein
MTSNVLASAKPELEDYVKNSDGTSKLLNKDAVKLLTELTGNADTLTQSKDVYQNANPEYEDKFKNTFNEYSGATNVSNKQKTPEQKQIAGFRQDYLNLNNWVNNTEKAIKSGYKPTQKEQKMLDDAKGELSTRLKTITDNFGSWKDMEDAMNGVKPKAQQQGRAENTPLFSFVPAAQSEDMIKSVTTMNNNSYKDGATLGANTKKAEETRKAQKQRDDEKFEYQKEQDTKKFNYKVGQDTKNYNYKASKASGGSIDKNLTQQAVTAYESVKLKVGQKDPKTGQPYKDKNGQIIDANYLARFKGGLLLKGNGKIDVTKLIDYKQPSGKGRIK